MNSVQLEQGELLRLALNFSSVGDWNWEASNDLVELSPLARAIFGVDSQSRWTWTEMQQKLLHPDDAPKAAAAVLKAISERNEYRTEYRVRRAGELRWILATGKAQYSANGSVASMVGLVQDITDRKHQEQALRDEAAALDLLNSVGRTVASELNLEKVVQAVTDAGVAITGAQFGAFFYNVLKPEGGQYMLYTLSGVPREAFSRFPMPRNTPVFAPTFEGKGIVRSDDITRDARYGQLGPHRGMPKGHLPVRSYLAVPVNARSGEVVGGLFFGHAEPAIFTSRHERLIVGVAAHAAVAIENARLYSRAQNDLEERRKAEDALRQLADALEIRVRDRTHELESVNARLQDQIAEREKAETALRHAQKLEAIGHLTGGVAHDFNNLLTVVIGNLDNVLPRLAAADLKTRRAIEASLEASRRAASLTQRLLAFARRQPLSPKALDPNSLVRQLSELLHRTIGEATELETVLGAGIWNIEVDPDQLEAALLNLVLNARDAMPSGGKLTIETVNAHVDALYAKQNDIKAGQYVVISVTDTGVGISPETIDRVIEPFFTTKPSGQGTGLGLSQVYGFARQSNGNMRIYSEVGNGTTVKLYLPRFSGQLSEIEETTELVPADGQEVVVVVEDEPAVRELAVGFLEQLGYKVFSAHDGPQAMELLGRLPRVDLLFTDVGLPKMNGRQLAEQARTKIPGLKVLFTTGYAQNAIVHHGRLDPGVALIGKPYTLRALSERVRDVLDKS